jgi:putative NADPH-quinone reductase
MKRIVVINGHPNPRSLNKGLVDAYVSGAEQAGAAVQTIDIGQLQFNPNLQFGYQQRMKLEPDLLDAWDKIKWAQHLVWIHPVWWGGLPAITKGFVDRLFLPGIAFKYHADSIWWDKLLSGKTARNITTLDQPGWYYWLAYGRPSVNQLKRSTLEFCGIKPVAVSYMGIVRKADERQRKQWINQAYRLGSKMR